MFSASTQHRERSGSSMTSSTTSLVTGGRQAVHELGACAGEVHHVHGDLILGIEHVHVVLTRDLLVVQAIPHVGVDEVGAL